MSDDYTMGEDEGRFWHLVRTSHRPRVARTAEMSDEAYCAAEMAAGTPEAEARVFAGLPPAE